MAHDQRAARLKRVFYKVISGEQQIISSQSAQHFLEGIRLFTTAPKTPSACVETIVSSAAGLKALHSALRVDLTDSFLLSQTLPTLSYLSDPGIKALADGQLLHKVLHATAEPPTLWNALVQLFRTHQTDPLFASFTWLSFELISLRPKLGLSAAVINDIQTLSDKDAFLKTEHHPSRELGYKIKRIIQMLHAPEQNTPNGPGGRHDNDHADYRQIRTFPTTDEFRSTELPFYRTAKEVLDTKPEERARIHLDNQYRLLREDMLAELREDFHVALGVKKGRRSALILGGLRPISLNFGDEEENGRFKFKKCTMLLQCYEGLHFLEKKNPAARKKFFADEKNFLKHQAFGVLCRGKEIFGFAFVDRDVDLLVKSPPVVSLQFTDARGFGSALLALAVSGPVPVQFIVVDTAVFAYEPILLSLQAVTHLPFQNIITDPSCPSASRQVQDSILQPMIDRLQQHLDSSGKGSSIKLPARLGQTAPVFVDRSQLEAIVHALTSAISIIQGPPGTGKSFTSAQIARFFHDVGLRILVISYTNHALNQLLEDLIRVGISRDYVVRIGARAKCTPAVESLLLSSQARSYRRTRDAWNLIEKLRVSASHHAGAAREAITDYARSSIKWEDISQYLEFSEDDVGFFEAFQVPINQGGWQQTGKKGKKIGADYLFNQWSQGKDAGVFVNVLAPHCRAIWDIPVPEREARVRLWIKNIVAERLEGIQECIRKFNNAQEEIDIQFSESDADIVRSKTLLGCTTTAAAKHGRLIRAFRPDVVLVEEAGEILESHILTALAPTVQHLVLVGDHKQLRPKINNYDLSVEKGSGFDLNCSMFERLIKQGAKHQTLLKQHRMVPEISLFPRRLTYPDLVDDPKTMGRDRIRGLRDRVIFVNHSKPEDTDNALRDRRDPGVKESKKNLFEAEMVVRCVKYMGQQGYSTSQIVVLTPYLGQLRVLQEMILKGEYAVELGEMDKRELIRAGLMTQAAAQVNQAPIRISTIDNYQGEESDIVIASLTRSNETGDVGFMCAPERLNVLITRARNCLVLIGNMATFMNSKKGAGTWVPFFELMKEQGHLYDGLPVKCEKHPEIEALLQEPSDFDKFSPDGGCTKLCNAPLKCGIHKCQSRCHRISDHSKAECRQLVDKTCDRGHKTRVFCTKRNDDCHACIKEDKQTERRAKMDLQRETERQRSQTESAKELQKIEDELESQKTIAKYQAEEENEKKQIKERQAELAAFKEAEKKKQERKQWQDARAALNAAKAKELAKKRTAGTASPPADSSPEKPDSAAAEWKLLKQVDGAQNKALDELMTMIGLEKVKHEFLSILSRVELATLQGTSLATERFSCSMLGNPGTGKTTVARLYARFLTELDVIPGTCFKETTGSAMASNGVQGCKKLIDEILKESGGVLFVDEAYQLTSGNNPGGGAVLDYLLAEVENLRGKVVFVLAGYNKQMESFFAHNPGLPSRFPIQMDFADYSDAELLRILEFKVNGKYGGLMECEDGLRGLYCRIVARRIGYGRGKDGFGNARAVENTLSNISRRQADRIRRVRLAGGKPNDMLFTKEDLIGPKPTAALANCPAWQKLQQLIGLSSVKEAVKALVDTIQQNYERELTEQPRILYSLNKVFLGNPGTGKTTVAQLYGEILVAVGMLSKGEVVVKNPSDFVGSALGQSEQNTKGILAATVGKVLVIDEAYGLYGGGDGQGASADPYKTAVIDTIVAEVQSVPGDDRCVLLLGYKDQMEQMFQNVNPGLSRRFPVASGFTFEDFSQDELRVILDLKLKADGYRATDEAKQVAMDMLDRARYRPNFGNAGEINIILDATKIRHQRRVSRMESGESKTRASTLLEARDFDEHFDRADKAETNVRMLFQDTVGSENVVALLEEYQDTVRTMRELKLDPKESIPFNFLFRGPPGTGKTTTAKKMGRVFHDMGFLATPEVVECSATDLIGQYVGQTGPKVQKKLDQALGRVLFVDEAYRLAEGHFAKEAVDELVDCITKERYQKKLIIILAGYDADINRLLSVNAGLSSRFPAVVDFKPLPPQDCVSLMHRLLKKKKDELLSRDKHLDLSCLDNPSSWFSQQLLLCFERLIQQDSWASARDVQCLTGTIFNRLLRCKASLDKGGFILKEDIVLQELGKMIRERAARTASAVNVQSVHSSQPRPQLPFRPPPSATPPRAVTATATTLQTAQADRQASPVGDITEGQEERTDIDIVVRKAPRDVRRDAGVSDEVWEQLQRDRDAEDEREEEYRRLKEAARKASAAARAKIVERLVKEEEERKKEAEKQKKLALMGACPMGYAWIKQHGGYRCAGGSHYISDVDISLAKL
ncbi:helicase required for RNAi-mediated heterochromatin assembly 1 [Echria macrotheca]|uniref:Helicase required for RNAi-mediated heterochromatin assembly 1 n=1 Tax=Echria macrotheca TaxID=438768 RepID=A0AAJ0F0B0_9PEZI|nr:helicase required for RNAi-mediated heterochromatin assembly 1 [Echria macrotheca]